MPKNEYTCDCNSINTELVAKVHKKMQDENFSAVSSFFKIIGDETRCKLIFALLQSEMCVCDLANVLSMTKSSVSHQLAKMRCAGIVKCRRDGKEVYYSLDDYHVAELFEIASTHLKHLGE